MSQESISFTTEHETFRDMISQFMDQYSKTVGFVNGFTSTLISNSILNEIEMIIQNNKNTILSAELTSSLRGLGQQVSLSEVSDSLRLLGRGIRILPIVSLANSLYEDWQSGNDYPYKTMKDALTIVGGVIACGVVGIVAGSGTIGLLSAATIAGLVGSAVDAYWDDIENKLKDVLEIREENNALRDFAQRQSSPLVIDLDGDGIETSKEDSSVHFDHDGNNFAESTGWVGKDDGLLVRDINGNGQIDDGTELFGNNSVLSSGEKATNFSL